MTGERWQMRVGVGRDGEGQDGPWKGAEELRRKRQRVVSKCPICRKDKIRKISGEGGKIYIRLDAAALERMVRGMASGDG